MARKARVAPGGYVYHVLNRGNCRMEIFSKAGDFAAFEKLLEEARRRTGMRILAWCLMPNHWHLVLWPTRDGDLAKFVGWLSNTHVRRWRAHRESEGEGHLYQGRYKSFIMRDDAHLLTVLRYVEQNPLRACLSPRAEAWRWSSACDQAHLKIDDGPIDRPSDWLTELNRPIAEKELAGLRASVDRGRPYGDERWVAQLAGRLGLLHTVRDPWRPRTKEASERRTSQRRRHRPVAAAAPGEL